MSAMTVTLPNVVTRMVSRQLGLGFRSRAWK